MSFKILLLAPDADPSWPEKIRRAVPGVVVNTYSDPQDALDDIADADAAYGTVPPELLARARKLRWICAARAGLGGAWFYDALVNSDVLVTNMRGSYNEHLAAHAVAFLLAFARRFDHYLPQKRWQRGPQMIDLPEQTVLIVGVGGADPGLLQLLRRHRRSAVGFTDRDHRPVFTNQIGQVRRQFVERHIRCLSDMSKRAGELVRTPHVDDKQRGLPPKTRLWRHDGAFGNR